ncbi:uncharacterized protein LOC134747199 [Cydia strobilella]|uniref:uncharacterized protein LOC134747199 n=1 Tax=Cydia strobilella TaxID=1100964 RepID=UPI003006C4BB
MKNSIFKEKFIATNFVKPLYRVKFTKTPNDVVITNLVGDAYNLTKNVPNITVKETQKYRILPGACEVYNHYDLKCDRSDNMEEQRDNKDALSDAFRAVTNSKLKGRDGKKHISFSDSLDLDLDDDNQETWLRVCPAPVLPDESIGSVLFRFMACQLGITTFIIVWTAIWVAVIHSYEGPNENLVNEEYARQQNQLVIDLATELRLITPVSPKWQKAITTRVEEAREQTMLAAGRGAKLDPGRYWNLAGTFLFTVFVMTALGFGAPVPQTIGGRCFALLYAVFAIPFHVYLMMQASTCAVAHVNHYLALCHKNIRRPKLTPRADNDGKTNMHVKAYRRRKKLSRLLTVLTAGHCVPIASLLYYMIGVLVFGLGRYQKTETVDVLMFPLQFTTNGGLSSVESHFRVLYGFYVEGAMALLTCTLAALRRYSGNSFSDMTEKYRLFTKG